MKENKKDIPEGIVDIEAYENMLKLQDHPVIKNKIRNTSDGTEINLGWMPHHLKKKIEHLPKAEQKIYEKLKQTFFNVNNQLTVYKRQAVGKKQGSAKAGIPVGDDSLLETKKEELLEYFGRMFTIEDVLKIVNKEWAIQVGKGLLIQFKLKYGEEIKKRIESHQSSYHNLRLGIKKSRLEELSDIYKQTKENWNDSKKREDTKILLSVLEQLRKEAEGDRLTIDGKVDISYEQNINLHLMKEVFATTNLKEIILGRVAAKMNINPIKLIYSLNTSHYKAFSNVLGDFDPDNGEETVYPSQMNYDFEKINKFYENREKQFEDAIILEDRKDNNDLDKAKSLKEKIAEKLKNKNKGLNDLKTKLDIYDESK